MLLCINAVVSQIIWSPRKGVILIPTEGPLNTEIEAGVCSHSPFSLGRSAQRWQGYTGDRTAGFSLFTDLVSLRPRGVSDYATYTFWPFLWKRVLCVFKNKSNGHSRFSSYLIEAQRGWWCTLVWQRAAQFLGCLFFCENDCQTV